MRAGIWADSARRCGPRLGCGWGWGVCGGWVVVVDVGVLVWGWCLGVWLFFGGGWCWGFWVGGAFSGRQNAQRGVPK
ncbi:hypothetical protein RA272_27505 [Pseudomonas syringae pv. tagetis]|uniref:hypothetical protein n=1 Tax=Pseudomonas syringae group genomosp. 7 TaxID=251699 RepID=UPI003770381C